MDVGLYGKLFSHGDFLRRRASDAFVDRWDMWLQKSMAASRAALGDRWLDLYLTSPAWRFACAPGVCGPGTTLGVMVPSVDRVGRYFPLTLVAEAPGDVAVMSAAVEGRVFFDRAEDLVLDALAHDEVDFDKFDQSVQRLSETLKFLDRPVAVSLDPAFGDLLGDDGGAAACGWHIPMASVDGLTPVWSQLLSHRLSRLFEPISLWWTEGSEAVRPTCLVVRGLPEPESFRAFLDGTWSPERWRTAAAAIEPDAAVDDTLRVPVASLSYRSAGATDVGHVRKVNQDCFLERPEIGLWVVADGLGGHTDGDVASRMVCDALADFDPAPAFTDTIEGVRARMREVNEHLMRTSEQALRGAKIGSTVVVLLIRGDECAVLWAGDSRIYRVRGNRIQQLTRDHGAALSPSGDKSESNVITRAVGVAPELVLDVLRDAVQPGDKFLLCSDGLTRRVSDEEIEAWLQHEDIDASVDGLIQATLDAGAPDNVTVLIAEATGAHL